VHYSEKKKSVKKLYSVQREISNEFLSQFVGKKIKVLCDGIDYERNCFIGRAYFNAPDIDGKVYFNAYEGVQGQYYEVLVTSHDDYDLFAKTEEYGL
jgi:tRNA A37 methylthiotransferase MiaB